LGLILRKKGYSKNSGVIDTFASGGHDGGFMLRQVGKFDKARANLVVQKRLQLASSLATSTPLLLLPPTTCHPQPSTASSTIALNYGKSHAHSKGDASFVTRFVNFASRSPSANARVSNRQAAKLNDLKPRSHDESDPSHQ
jgi:16S rRNA A1518/A1519 N6-dimethyltransferase RsmA/KsgA/DIM1 with predicted DNA glycosylase/AP lyase activity